MSKEFQESLETFKKNVAKMEAIAERICFLRHGETNAPTVEFYNDTIEYTYANRWGEYAGSGFFPMSYIFDPDWEELEEEDAKKKKEEARRLAVEKAKNEASRIRRQKETSSKALPKS